MRLLQVTVVTAAILAEGLVFSGCGVLKSGGSAAQFDPATAEVLAGTLAAQVTATETVSFAQLEPDLRSPATRIVSKAWDAVIPQAYAAACGTFVTDAGSSACVGAGLNVVNWVINCQPLWNPTATWDGTWTFSFNSAPACALARAGGLLATGNGNSFVLTSPTGVRRTAANGYYLITDSGPSGYSSLKSGGTTVSCGAPDCQTTRTVNVAGLHRAFYNPLNTRVADHTISTPTALSVTGTGANRKITAGSVEVQHNIAKFTSVSTIISEVTFTAGCCFPTGGSAQTSFSAGSRTGGETITFGPACGTARVGSAEIALTHCY